MRVRNIVLGVLALSTIALAEDKCFIETKLNIREKPTTHSKVVGKYNAGEIVKIKDKKNSWYKTDKGWIRKFYCSPVDKKKESKIKEAEKLGSLTPKKKEVNPYEPQIVEDMFSYVNISLTDINRITCPTDIKWFTYSKEKEIQITKAGKNLLVKILPKVITQGNQSQLVRDSFPRELLVECEGQVFTLILLPKKIPTETVILRPKFANKKKALKFETENPYEKTIKELIRKAYREEAIDGYEIKITHKLYKKFKQLDMYLERVYKGAYYTVKEFSLVGKQNVNLAEKLFIPYLQNPIAISLTKLHLSPGEKARMFVIEKQEDK